MMPQEDDPLEQLKKLKSAVVVPSDDPLAELKRTKVSAVKPVEVSDDSTMGYGERFATTLAQAAQVIPGMRNLEAGAAAVGSHLPKALGGTGAPVSYREALEGLDEQTEGMGKGRKFLAEAAASPVLAPVMAMRGIRALSLPSQGAVLGAASGAASGLDPDATATSTALNTGLGAAGGYVGGGLLKGAGALATKTGVTDAVASGARKLGGAAADIGEAIGTKGAANKVLQGRQAILDQLSGSEQTAAKTMLDHVDNYKAQAKDFYDVARQDTRAVDDPRVREALNDPRVQQIMDIARARVRGTPAVEAEAALSDQPARLGSGQLRGNTSRVDDSALADEIDRLRELQSRDQQILAGHKEHGDYHDALELRSVGAKEDADGLVDPMLRSKLSMLEAQVTQRQKALTRLEAEAANRQAQMRDAESPDAVEGSVSFDFGKNTLPQPEELAMAKRLLDQVVQQKFNAPQGINSAEAAQLAPKLDALRSALHDASPAWKNADHFYAQAKNFEDAFTKAYGAQQNPTAAALSPRKLKSTEAIQAWAERPTETPRQLARRSGVQAGTAARITKEVAAQPIGANVGDVLKAPSLKSSPAAAALRRPAFADDQASRAFAELLGKTGAEGAKEAAGPATFGIGKFSLTKTPGPNLLERPAGVELRAKLAEALSNPATAPAIRAALMQSQKGQALLRALEASGVGAVAAAGQVPAGMARDAVRKRIP